MVHNILDHVRGTRKIVLPEIKSITRVIDEKTRENFITFKVR
jgi:hypothetical protein